MSGSVLWRPLNGKRDDGTIVLRPQPVKGNTRSRFRKEYLEVVERRANRVALVCNREEHDPSPYLDDGQHVGERRFVRDHTLFLRALGEKLSAATVAHGFKAVTRRRLLSDVDLGVAA